LYTFPIQKISATFRLLLNLEVCRMDSPKTASLIEDNRELNLNMQPSIFKDIPWGEVVMANGITKRLRYYVTLFSREICSAKADRRHRWL
jgi:hypothetical protein